MFTLKWMDEAAEAYNDLKGAAEEIRAARKAKDKKK